LGPIRWADWPTAASAGGRVYLAAVRGLIPLVLLLLDTVARRRGALTTKWFTIDFSKGVDSEERPAVEINTSLGFQGQPINDSAVISCTRRWLRRERTRSSGWISEPALYRRAAEATTLRTHLDGLLHGHGRDTAAVLAGDMNDEVSAATTQILNGPPGSAIGTVGFGRPDEGDGDRMWNLAPLISPEQRFTRKYRGRPELVDHIFITHFLASGDRTTEVTTRMAEGVLPSIEDNPNTRRGKPGSDHAAVIAAFNL
jgi:hypothetical protein